MEMTGESGAWGQAGLSGLPGGGYQLPVTVPQVLPQAPQMPAGAAPGAPMGGMPTPAPQLPLGGAQQPHAGRPLVLQGQGGGQGQMGMGMGGYGGMHPLLALLMSGYGRMGMGGMMGGGMGGWGGGYGMMRRPMLPYQGMGGMGYRPMQQMRPQLPTQQPRMQQPYGPGGMTAGIGSGIGGNWF